MLKTILAMVATMMLLSPIDAQNGLTVKGITRAVNNTYGMYVECPDAVHQIVDSSEPDHLVCTDLDFSPSIKTLQNVISASFDWKVSVDWQLVEISDGVELYLGGFDREDYFTEDRTMVLIFWLDNHALVSYSVHEKRRETFKG